ncbi:hypothetical protein [Halococcus saccharolyticus]|uniref:hypothetical protein n=1 Tax=Halococcus saccharolyticus TaxID=62319 RepID=UPI000A6CBEFF|nr:hypothetical protein [Halococcus saccharolyticus]
MSVFPSSREKDGRRPDPSEPWRYECPECGSVRVRTNANNGKAASRTSHDFHCQSCYAAFDEPADRKGGEESKPPPDGV